MHPGRRRLRYGRRSASPRPVPPDLVDDAEGHALIRPTGHAGLPLEHSDLTGDHEIRFLVSSIAPCNASRCCATSSAPATTTPVSSVVQVTAGSTASAKRSLPSASKYRSIASRVVLTVMHAAWPPGRAPTSVSRAADGSIGPKIRHASGVPHGRVLVVLGSSGKQAGQLRAR